MAASSAVPPPSTASEDQPTQSASSDEAEAVTPASGPAVVEAGGFRLVISAPKAGSAIDAVTTLCYEVTASGREPEIALDVALLGPDGDVQAGPNRVQVPPGRGAAEVRLSGAAAGTYDLRVQLLDSETPIDGAALVIPGVTLGTDSEPPACA